MSTAPRNLVDEIAERDLLGALILAGNRENVTEINGELFGTQLHRDIAAAIVHLIEHRMVVDYLEVANVMRRRGQDASIAYISDLGTGIVLARPIGQRVAHLRQLADRRKLAKLAEQLTADTSNLAMPLDDIKAMVLEAVR